MYTCVYVYTWMSHVTYMNESWYTWRSHVLCHGSARERTRESVWVPACVGGWGGGLYGVTMREGGGGEGWVWLTTAAPHTATRRCTSPSTTSTSSSFLSTFQFCPPPPFPPPPTPPVCLQPPVRAPTSSAEVWVAAATHARKPFYTRNQPPKQNIVL